MAGGGCFRFFIGSAGGIGIIYVEIRWSAELIVGG